MSAVLSVRELCKTYLGKTPFVSLDGISFDLKEGEILGLLGPNGAGKTTTIQILMSTLKATSGSILYFGKDFIRYRSEVLKKVSFASTYVSLPWNLTIDQNLEVFGRLFEISPIELKMRKKELLERFGIYEKRKNLVASLSAGQITRLMLVKAFMVNPKIVLLDEPTASLDPDIAKDVCEFVLQQREKMGVSILFTSHNMLEISEVCDRVLFLKEGKIIADDVPEQLARSVSTSKVELVIADGMKRAIAVVEELMLPYRVEYRLLQIDIDDEKIAFLLTKLAEMKIAYTHIAIVQPTLADYFLQIAKGKM